MPFNSAGVYTPASGATTASPGQVVQSAIWDAIFTDLSDEGLSKVFTKFGNDNAETTIASAATVDLSTATSLRVLISGSVTITSLGTAGINLIKIIRFSGSPQLTYNAASLILPGAVSIRAFAGDQALVTSDASGNWRVLSWQSADGLPPIHQDDFRNILWMNGSLDIWQRGAGSSASIAVGATTTAYTADRWYLTTAANQASVVAAVTALGTQSILAGRVRRNSGQTGTGGMIFGYPLDTDECVRLRGKVITLSFLGIAGANFSPTSGTLNFNVYFGTGTAAKRGGGFSGETNPITGSVNLTTSASATSATSTAAVATNVTQGEVQFTWTPVGTAGAADDFTLDDVQLEMSTNASDYDQLPFSVLLDGCKRHYRKSFPYSVAPAQSAGLPGAVTIIAQAAVAQGIWVSHVPLDLRATGTYTSYHPTGASANWQNITNGASLAVSLDSAGIQSPEGTFLYASVNTASIAAGSQMAIHFQADAGI